MNVLDLARNQTDKSFLVLFFKKEHFFLTVGGAMAARKMSKQDVVSFGDRFLAVGAASDHRPAGNVLF